MEHKNRPYYNRSTVNKDLKYNRAILYLQTVNCFVNYCNCLFLKCKTLPQIGRLTFKLNLNVMYSRSSNQRFNFCITKKEQADKNQKINKHAGGSRRNCVPVKFYLRDKKHEFDLWPIYI